ncbi:MAG: immunoglobulin domain-containing protein [Phycisphaerales bacterium]|nr:immunoglobulin domain-containing protein [Phycisphaerales bacterium]
MRAGWNRIGFRGEAICTALAAVAAAAFVAAQPAVAQCTITASQTEGPYYRTPNPETTNLRIGSDGPPLTLHGNVVDTQCNPIAYTWVAVWHADMTGAYDNTAPFDRYRSFFFTDANGEFTLYTIMPGLYPGRTRHIHFKLDAVNTPLLTTQLYFPNEPQNATDGLYNPALEMDLVTESDGSRTGTFTFVLARSGGCAVPNVTGDPAPQTVGLGGTATFSMTASGGTPMTYQWRKDGVPLVNNARISGATTNSLRITGVTCSDAGAYTGAALNSCGTDESAAAGLTVTGCVGDLNCDGIVNNFDIDPFTLAVADAAAYEIAYPECDRDNADVNGDGLVNNFDIDPFVELLAG